MLNLFKNQYHSIFKGAGNDAIRSTAANVYGSKDFVEDNKPAYRFAKYFGYGTQFFTAVLASNYLAPIVQEVYQPNFAAELQQIVIIVSLLFIWEIGKRLSTKKAATGVVKNRYNAKDNPVPYLALLAGLVFYAGSVYSTLEGADNYAEAESDQSSEIETIFQATKDSINKHYSGLITGEEAKEKDYKKSVTYKGKINISNPTNKKRFAAYTASISEYKAERKEALDNLKTGKETSLSDNGETVSYNRNNILWGALLLEFFTLCCISYQFGFLAKVFIQDQKRTNAAPPPSNAVPVPRDEMKELLEVFKTMMHTSPEPQAIEPQRQAAGFHAIRERDGFPPTPSDVIDQNTPINIGINTGINTLPPILQSMQNYKTLKTSKKLGRLTLEYPQIVLDLINGYSLNQTATRNGYSKSHVQSVKKEMKALKIIA